MYRKVLAVLCTFLALGAVGAADPAWEIVDPEFAPMNASTPATGVLFMTVQDKDTGNTIEPGDQGCDTINTKYRYNTTGNRDMHYVPGSSGRYYATFPVSEANESITMEAWGTGCDEGDANLAASATVSFNASSGQQVRILNTSTRNQLLEGQQYTFAANVTHNGHVERDTTVNWTLYNFDGDPASNLVWNHGTTTYSPELGYYNSSVRMPITGDRIYYLVFEAANDSLSYSDPIGGDAQLLYVNETLEGTLTVLNNDSRCTTGPNSMAQSCQEGASLQITLNITQSQASNVTGWIEGQGKNLTNLTFTEISGSVWQANYTLPGSINTTRYGTDYNITVRANNSLDTLMKGHEIVLKPYRILAKGIGSKPQGSTARLYFRQEHPYTQTPIVRSQTDMFTVSIYYENGTQLLNETIGNGTSIGSTYHADSSELREGFVYSWDIPSDAPLGDYSMELNLTDIYGIEKNTLHFPSGATATSLTFRVYNASASSDVEIIDASLPGSNDDHTGAEKWYNEPQNISGGIVLKNRGGSPATVENITTTGNISAAFNYSIENHASVPFVIEEDTNDVINVDMALTEYGNYTGEIIFQVNGDRRYNRSFDLNYTVQKDCALSNETICTPTASIDLTFTGTADQQYNLTISNLRDTTRNVTVRPQGNISRFFTGHRINLTGHQSEEVVFDLPIQKGDAGNWSGSLVVNDSMNTLTIPTAMEVQIPDGSLNISVNGSTNLGTVIKTETRSRVFVLRNTGAVRLQNLSIISSALGLDRSLTSNGTPVDLAPGEEYVTSITLQFGQIAPGTYTNSSGIRVFGRSASGVEDSVTLTGTIREDLSSTLSSLEQEVQDLRDQLDSYKSQLPNSTVQAIQNDIEALSSTIQSARQAYSNGNYDQAQQLISEAQSTSSSIQTRIDNAVQGGSNGGSGNATDPGSGGDTPGTGGPGTNETGDGGGGGINPLLIIVPLVIITVVGAILYLSIVPEDQQDEPDYSNPPSY